MHNGPLATIAGLITGFIAATGYGGVALLMAIESACIPLPSEIIMPFAGYLVSTGRFSLTLVAVAGAIGCNLGSAAAYWVGARGGRAFIMRYGHWVLMSREDLDRAERFFARFGGIAVLIGRVLPVVRTFIALPAGIARMPLLRFHAYTFIGSLGWCYLLAWIGDQLGAKWQNDPRLGAVLHRFDYAIVAVVAIAGAWFVWSRLRARATVGNR
ncbi:MAG: DedA family protein [Acetobacteraceae bacterium]|nr:DedA family protein [Acetobacteraceae bacterium]